MPKKKTQKTKKVTSKTKKEININDIDAMLEDMKNLAMEVPKEEEIEIVSEKVEETSASVPKEKVIEIMVPESEAKLAYVDLPLENVETVGNFNTEDNLDVVEETQTEETKEEEITEEPKTEIKDMTEDLSFVDEVKQEEVKKEVKEEQKPKPRRKTYQEMFGGSWRGYGYDSY